MRPAVSTDTIIANVVCGLGVAIVDDWVTAIHLDGMKMIPLDSRMNISYAWSKANDNPALPVFIQELRRVFSDSKPA